MPVYEYRCAECRRKSAVFIRNPARAVEPRCEHCGGQRLTRLFSTFALRRPPDAQLDDWADDSALAGIDESDPRAMAQAMRRMGGNMREEIGPEFDEMVERMEAGEMPDEMGDGPGDDDFGGGPYGDDLGL